MKGVFFVILRDVELSVVCCFWFFELDILFFRVF